MRTTLRIRGLYAVALTQLFRQHSDTWEIVQPDEEVVAALPQAWRMDSPAVTIDDAPDEQGHREVLRLTGSAEAVQHALAILQQHCFDAITQQESLLVGAIYLGVVGICSRFRRRAVVYLGQNLVGILPLRYEDRDLKVGTSLPVRIAALPTEGDDRPQLSTSLTIPGQNVVLTSTQAVRLSKQITNPAQQQRLQRLGEQCNTDSWGIIWRTASQHVEDQALEAEVQHLMQETRAVRQSLSAATTVGYVSGGELAVQVYLPGHAKASCDTLRTQLRPTLPGHHKYKALGDIYTTTVAALEKELPPEVLRARTKTLSLLSSIDAMQHPFQDRFRILARDLKGALHGQGTVERVTDNIDDGWVEVQRLLQHQDDYPRALRLDRHAGDYTVTRFQEGSWSYITHFHSRQGTWQGAYACLTTPIAIFADQIQVVDLQVTVLHRPKHAPEVRGLEALLQQQQRGLVTAPLVQKVQEEAEALLRQMGRAAGT
ncbi:hypothetical protein NKDENANG_02278 [Candidatus Entotheonellaceae bacterium PAL068K]